MRFDDYNKLLPLAQASSLPAAAYFDDSGNHFLRQTWQYIGPHGDLKKNGDYITKTINGDPLVFVMRDGTIQGLHNVCRHKGAKIAKGSGNCHKFTCPYHGWTYGLDGKLLGVTEFNGVEDFCKEDNPLPPVQTDTHGPFLFACSSDGFSLQEALKHLGDTVPSNYLFVERKTYQINCNWKVFVDNFLDGCYHCGFVHRGLVSSIDNTKYEVKLYDNCVLQTAPIVPSEDENIRKVRMGKAVYYWWIFPTTMINVYGPMMDINAVFPLTDTTCEVIIDFYRAPEFNDEALIKSSIEMTDKVQVEDVAVCELVQEGMRSSSFDQGRYSVKREAGIYKFHQLLT
jgi:choline monooxygenase